MMNLPVDAVLNMLPFMDKRSRMELARTSRAFRLIAQKSLFTPTLSVKAPIRGKRDFALLVNFVKNPANVFILNSVKHLVLLGGTIHWSDLSLILSPCVALQSLRLVG